MASSFRRHNATQSSQLRGSTSNSRSPAENRNASLSSDAEERSASSSTLSSTSGGGATATTGLLRGTKPCTGGVSLTSTGLSEWDNLLGGGQPLGTAICLSSDRTQTLSKCFLQYWCSEALAHEQHLVIPCHEETEPGTDRSLLTFCLPEEDPNEELVISNSPFPRRTQIIELLQSLPRIRERTRRSSRRDDNSSNSSTSIALSAGLSSEMNLGVPLESLAEEGLERDEEEDDEDPAENGDDGSDHAHDDDDEGLTIAWQYRKSIQKARSGLEDTASTAPSTVHSRSCGKTASLTTDQVFCHTYDLRDTTSRRAEADKVHWVPTTTTSCRVPPRDQGYRYFDQICRRLQGYLSTEWKALRLMMILPQSNLSNDSAESLAVALPLLLTHIRSKLLPVVVLVVLPSCHGGVHPSRMALDYVHQCCDVALDVEHFATRLQYPPPPEFQRFQGLLHVCKSNTHTSATAHGSSSGPNVGASSGGGGGGGHFANWTTSKRAVATLYGLKRDQRSLRIQLLHIPPEEYGASDTGTSSSRLRDIRPPTTSERIGCSSIGSSSPLDF